MRSKAGSLNPILVILAVALVAVLFAVACGGSATSTAVPDTGAAEAAAAEAAAAEAAAAEAAAAAEVTTAANSAAATKTAAAAKTAAAKAAVEAAAEAAEQAKYGGSLRVAQSADHSTLDPGFTTASIDIATIENTYDPLIRVAHDGSYLPALATSWEISDDVKSYTFHLRKGVKFHSGKDFTSADVIFSLNRHLDPELETVGFSPYKVVDKIVAVDDFTVRFDLKDPNGFFMDMLPLFQSHILPTDVDFDLLPMMEFGTGPFMIEEYLPGERVTMVRNPNYWLEGRPYLDELILVGIAEAVTRAEALKSGDVDMIFRLDPTYITSLESHPDTKVASVATSGNYGVYFDNSVAPFDNKLVRKAIQAATDRVLINQATTLGLGAIGNDTPVWPTDSRWTTKYSPPDYDPELARSLLAQAGYPNGIDLVLQTGEVGPGMIELAVALKESTAPAGIRIEVHKNPTDSYWSEVFMVKPFSIIYWSGRSNPDHVLSLGYMSDSPWNANRFKNAELDELILRAKGEAPEAQNATYADIQRILIEEAPGLVIGFHTMHYGLRNNVNHLPNAHGHMLYTDAWVTK